MKGRTDREKESVRLELHAAFPRSSIKHAFRPLSHAECVTMRTQLPSLDDTSLPFYIGEVLRDLIETHTSKVGESEDAETVVQYLNVLGSDKGFATLRETYGEDWWIRHTQDEEFLRNARLAAFRSFNSAQASAICSWLFLARTWPEMEWYLGDIDSACQYWRDHAKS